MTARHNIDLRLEALRTAGVSFQEQGRDRYKVGPGFSYWPSTDRWRNTGSKQGGYGVQSLIVQASSSSR